MSPVEFSQISFTQMAVTLANADVNVVLGAKLPREVLWPSVLG